MLPIRVSDDELRVSPLALKAVELEFSENWEEFCTIAPGALDWYGLGPPDLEALATKLTEGQAD